jgi:hypothetical protein
MTAAHWWKDGVFDDAVYQEHLAREVAEKDARMAAACCATLDCGGWCRLPPGHDPPCLCDGDTDGPGSCPA